MSMATNHKLYGIHSNPPTWLRKKWNPGAVIFTAPQGSSRLTQSAKTVRADCEKVISDQMSYRSHSSNTLYDVGDATVSSVQWNPIVANFASITTDDGFLHCFDTRLGNEKVQLGGPPKARRTMHCLWFFPLIHFIFTTFRPTLTGQRGGTSLP